MGDIERRTFGPCEIREVTEDDAKGKKKGKVIQGYAAVFGVESEDLGGFREIIAPEAFDRALKEKQDVRALFNHNPDLVLGRTTADTLDLEADDHGLQATIYPPDTQMARDLFESIRRGDISGMSFAFRVPMGGDEWDEEGDTITRTVKDVDLLDVSPVAYPAYPQTEVSARAMERANNFRELAAAVRKAAAMSDTPFELNELRQRLAEAD